MPRRYDQTLSKFIACLTLAIGVGAMFNRAGGIYFVVADQRALWSIAIVNIGSWVLISSLLHTPILRACIMALCIALWCALGWRFYVNELWGAVLQSAVIVVFGLVCLRRLYLWWQSEQNAAA